MRSQHAKKPNSALSMQLALCSTVHLYAGVEFIPAFFTHSHMQQETIHDYGDPLVLLLHPKESMESVISRFISETSNLFAACSVTPLKDILAHHG